jgi:hypothetical protein
MANTKDTVTTSYTFVRHYDKLFYGPVLSISLYGPGDRWRGLDFSTSMWTIKRIEEEIIPQIKEALDN